MTRYTDEQQQVIATRQRHQRVVAVAGSGKTSTLLGQTAALLADGVPPRRLLVLMYNRSTQQDFLSRLRAVHHGPMPDVRTFHSLGFSIYRTLIQRGLLPPIQGDILGSGELEPRIWRWLQELASTGEQAQDILNNKRKWVEPALTFFERVKAGLEPPALVFKQLGLPGNAQLLVKTFERFEKWRKEAQRITFSDMLYDPVNLFSQRADLAVQFANHLDHIIVDEYQDINANQQFLLEILAGERATVTVVGDPDQTIYEFRGSDPSFMLHHFPTQFPDSAVHTLSHTFRYGPQVALAANHLIQHNLGRQPILTCAHSGTPDTALQLHRTDDDTTLIMTWLQQSTHAATDIAVLFRLWAQAARMELQLLTQNIPFQLETERGVLQRSELQPLLLLLSIASGRFAQQNKAERAQGWLTLLTQPYPKIQRDILKQMAQRLASGKHELYKHFMAQLPPKCSHWQQEQLALRGNVIQLAERPGTSAKQLISAWLNNTDYLNALVGNAFSAQQGDEQKETVQAFLHFLQQHDRTAAETDHWLQQLSAQRQTAQPKTGITLTSIHKAKGREWSIVFIPGLNRHFYPYRPEGDLRLPVDEESERRLLYVALTRGQREVHLSTPTAVDERSPFVPEMEIPLAQTLGQALRDPAQQTQNTLTLNIPLTKLAQQYVALTAPNVALRSSAETSATASSAPDGQQRVQHNHFGMGWLLRSEAKQLHIRFDDGKTRVFERDLVLPLLTFVTG